MKTKTETKYKVTYSTGKIETVEVFGAEKHHYYIEPNIVQQKKCREYRIVDTHQQAYVILFTYLNEKLQKQTADLEKTKNLLIELTCQQ